MFFQYYYLNIKNFEILKFLENVEIFEY